MTRRVAVLALIATTVGAWPALDEKLRSYPSIHARETAKIKAGDAKGAKYILFDAFHGLGNREQALLSSFALALATDSALFVSWTPIGCNSNADVNKTIVDSIDARKQQQHAQEQHHYLPRDPT